MNEEERSELDVSKDADADGERRVREEAVLGL